MGALTQNENIKKVLLDIARKEKEYVREFQTPLLKYDKEKVVELEEGEKGVIRVMVISPIWFYFR